MPQTMQATEREIRTFAYEFRLLQKAGFELDVQQFAADNGHMMRLMHDWYCVPGGDEEARTAYCKRRILECIEEVSSESALHRLEAWLDQTHLRLQALCSDRNEQLLRETERFRGDGSVYHNH